jgi:hypothetical protein
MAITDPVDPLDQRSRGATPSLRSRLAWMLVLWLAGVFTLGAVSLLLRLWLKAPLTSQVLGIPS